MSEMTFEEFWTELWAPEAECCCGLCAERQALCRRLYNHLIATGADVRAVLEGSVPEPSDRSPEQRIMQALAEIVRLPICDAEEVIEREPVMIEVQRIKSACDELRKDLAQAKARIAELEAWNGRALRGLSALRDRLCASELAAEEDSRANRTPNGRYRAGGIAAAYGDACTRLGIELRELTGEPLTSTVDAIDATPPDLTPLRELATSWKAKVEQSEAFLAAVAPHLRAGHEIELQCTRESYADVVAVLDALEAGR